MKQYVIALDQGTTSSRCIIFDKGQNIVALEQREFSQHYPKPGWVEHDPMEIYSSQYGVLMEVLAHSGILPQEIAGIGITNQRETAIVWDKETGKPVYNAIVWQCRRTAALCEELKKDAAFTEYVKENTGLLIDAYFSGTKIKWILDNVPGAREKAEAGRLLFGTVDTWLIWKMTGGRTYVTDYTNASRTMLYNIKTLCWDEAICRRLGIPMSMLPEVCDSSRVYGTVNIQGTEVPIAGIAGDQQAALFGQTCFAPGEAKNTYGTGCFLLMNTGGQRVRGRRRHSMGARRTAVHHRIARCGILCPESARHGRRVPGARLHRPWRPLLGHVCPRLPGWPDARHHARAHYPRRAGIYCLPKL